MAERAVLTVRLYGHAIGTITQVGGERTLFSFSESYIQNRDRPILGLRFKDAFGELISDLRHIASVIAAQSDLRDIAEFIRRLTFNVLIGNGDMHLKNWSLIYTDQHRAQLSPAYDFVSTIAYLPDDKSALTFSRAKDFTAYTLDELKHLAAKAALPPKLVTDTAKDTVAAFMACWATEKSHLPLDRNTIQTVDRHLQTLPIVRNAG